MNYKLKDILCILIGLSLFLGGCSSGEIILGKPTKLKGQDPHVLICQIQEKFKNLKKPVFTKINYYKPWTDYTFPDDKNRQGESYDIILNDESYNFIKEHSPIEIRTALIPLIIDSGSGADVLAIIEGMWPRGKKKNFYGGIPSHIIGKYRELPATKKYLSKWFKFHQGHYKGEVEESKRRIKQMKWDYETRVQHLLSPSPGVMSHTSSKDDPRGTLEYEILKELKSYSDLNRGVSLPDWTTKQTISYKHSRTHPERIFNAEPQYPIIGKNLKKFISSNNKKFTAINLLSLADIYTLGILLNLQEKYWVTYTTNWNLNNLSKYKDSRKYKAQMLNEIISTIYSHCDD